MRLRLWFGPVFVLGPLFAQAIAAQQDPTKWRRNTNGEYGAVVSDPMPLFIGDYFRGIYVF